MTPDSQRDLTLAVAAMLQERPVRGYKRNFICRKVDPFTFSIHYKPENWYILNNAYGVLYVSTYPISRNIWNAVMREAKLPLEKITHHDGIIVIATPWGNRTVEPRRWISVAALLDPHYEP